GHERADSQATCVGQAADAGLRADPVEFFEYLLLAGAVYGPTLPPPRFRVAERNGADPQAILALEHRPLAPPAPLASHDVQPPRLMPFTHPLTASGLQSRLRAISLTDFPSANNCRAIACRWRYARVRHPLEQVSRSDRVSRWDRCGTWPRSNHCPQTGQRRGRRREWISSANCRAITPSRL